MASIQDQHINMILNNDIAFYRINDLLSIIPVSKATIWNWVKAGKFPQPTKISSRVTVWKKKQIHEFLDQMNQPDVPSPV